MQLLLVRHGLPVRVEDAAGRADPGLAANGVRQAERVYDAISRHKIVRVVSSPQRRALETAAPTAQKLGLDVETVPGLAEYDIDLPFYIPIEDAKYEFAAAYERIKSGELPEQIDADAFVRRVVTTVNAIAAGTGHADTAVAFAHGGVVNTYLQHVLGNARPLAFPIDYCSVTRVLFSRTGRRTVASVNETEHVWDLLPRNVS